jgi:hypothetical protein
MSVEKKPYDLAELRKAIGVLFEPGQIVEIRMMDKKKKLTAAGWFDDMELMAKTVPKLARERMAQGKRCRKRSVPNPFHRRKASAAQKLQRKNTQR